MEVYIDIEGVICTNKEVEEFRDEFISWIESKGYEFCGTLHHNMSVGVDLAKDEN